MGIAWYKTTNEDSKPNYRAKGSDVGKPLLLLLPGLAGGYNNMYTHAVAEKAMKNGFKCGVGLFRCADDIPVTSFKATATNSWQDAKDIIEYVHKSYICDEKGKKLTNFYVYGASLGAILLNGYLIRASGD